MNSKVLLIGFINEYSKLEKKKYNEFLLFLKGFADNLGKNISPEKAFIQTCSQFKPYLIILQKTLNHQLFLLINYSYSFHEVIENLKKQLNSIRFKIILDVLDKIVNQNPYFSSEKINEILFVISRHKKLEKKLELIIKGEKFKILFFIFLLPIIIGFIGGLFPFFFILTNNNELGELSKLNLLLELVFLKDFIIILFTLISTISLSSYYLMKIIKSTNKIFLISITNLLFILTFLISFINILQFI